MIEIKAKADQEADIFVYGEIGESYWSDDTVTAKKFAADLKDVGDVKKLNIFINSGGGNIFDAQAILSMLKRNTAEKVVYIDGLAASAASVIAMAGDRIIMPSNSMLMIHRAWTGTSGNIHDFERTIETLKQVDGSISGVYSERTGKEQEEILTMMDAETWMTAAEAYDLGFADEIEKESKVAASIDGSKLLVNGLSVDLTRYKNTPHIEIGDKTDPPEEADPPEDVDPTPILNDSGEETRPVSDTSYFSQLRKKIITD